MGWKSPENIEKNNQVTLKKEKIKQLEKEVEELIGKITRLLKYHHDVSYHSGLNGSSPIKMAKVCEFDDGAKQSLWLDQNGKWFYRLFQRARYIQAENRYATPVYTEPEYVGSTIEALLRAFLDIKFGCFAEASNNDYEDQIGEHIKLFRANILLDIKKKLGEAYFSLQKDDDLLDAMWVLMSVRLRSYFEGKELST